MPGRLKMGTMAAASTGMTSVSGCAAQKDAGGMLSESAKSYSPSSRAVRPLPDDVEAYVASSCGREEPGLLSLNEYAEIARAHSGAASELPPPTAVGTMEAVEDEEVEADAYITRSQTTAPTQLRQTGAADRRCL